MNKIYKG